MVKQGLLAHLTARGLVEQVSDPALGARLDERPITAYAGFDPTADSLHLGHLVPVMILAWLQRYGHRVLPVVGGATGMVGDPSGRSDERNLQTADQVKQNALALKGQLSRFMDFDPASPASAVMLDNLDWIGPMTFVDWLRDVGRHFTISYMLAKDSVKLRMEKEQGISFTEFSYMTMQAYDFLHLHRAQGCDLQVGGRDQWGNITAGIELIRRVTSHGSYGLTCPLITTASGEKFGKSAGNAVWLDAARTSPYQFFQYWLKTADADVAKYLKLFTFMPLDEIEALVAEGEAAPERRLGQKRLAVEITRLVHSEAGLAAAERATQVLFGQAIDKLSDRDVADIFADVPVLTLPRARLGKWLLVDLFAEAGLCKSKSEARRLIANGGAYLNNRKVESDAAPLDEGCLVSETALVLRTGKKNFAVVRFDFYLR